MLFERWVNASDKIKFLFLLIGGGMIFVVIEWSWIQPRHSRLKESLLIQQRAYVKMDRLRHEVMALTLATRAALPHASDTTQHFSVMTLVSQSGGNLQKWLPDNNIATLELLLAWEKLPALFSTLSNYGGVRLQSFSVEPQGDRLHLTLKLELTDEP